ncbi:MAG: hypothetical protein ABR548_03900 [Actinomycetota bacterium]
MSFAHVVLIGSGVAHLDQAYTYRVPDDDVHVGSLVRVPVRGKSREGIVVELLDESDVPRVQPIRAVLGPGLAEDVVHVCHSVAEHYLSSFGEALAAAVPQRTVSEEEIPPREPSMPLPDLDVTWLREFASGGTLLRHIEDHTYKGFATSGAWLKDRGHAIASLACDVVRRGRGVLILLPDLRGPSSIAQSLEATLGDNIAWVGSDRPTRERYRDWLALRRGTLTIAAGGRSAVFAPVQDLGLVIMYDEAHVSFKEKRTPRFHARPVAADRARSAGAVFLAIGIPPSAEVMDAMERRVLQGMGTDSIRATKKPPDRPAVLVIDRTKAEDRLVPSARTLTAMRAALDAGRRAVLLVHRGGESLRTVAARTERVLKTKAVRLDARSLSADKSAFEDAIRHAPLLIATPVIARDVELERIGCVAVVEADAALSVPEFRASEEALATWRKCARWLSRQDVFVIETDQPKNPAIETLVRWNMKIWWHAESTRRKELGYPPYAALVRIDTTPERAADVAETVRAAAPDAEILGPVEEEGRSVIIVRQRAREALIAALSEPARAWRAEGIDVRIDVDPREVLP